ncbi:16S rRNA (adenine(1518)-N(6)/adenine(1519)-N(6))-dimethyltransferase RsmA [Patescibacteria group bacterium]|nr:16S rRNA (adenine(1518)-N(6)/adenine(1519)-N(6))-dimethyltransferase RsmA [Patescibacteria group bacterium]
MYPFLAKKSLGQNFLTNPKIAEKIAQSALITPGDTVFEIGPGTGMLTRALIHEGARVIAVEADIRAIETLEETFREEIRSGLLTLVHGDMRTLDLQTLTLPEKYKVAANIPYYLSGMLFAAMLEQNHQPETIVFLVQKEVAERIARSKKESILSLSIKIYGIPRYIDTVSRGNFSPIPGVDSAILQISNISKQRLGGVAEDHFFTVIKTGLKAKRKHLLGNLSVLTSRENLVSIFTNLKIPPDARGEDLPIEKWVELAKEIPNL